MNFDGNIVKIFWDLLKDSDIRNYVFKNFLFEIPGINKKLFAKDAQKIVPSLSADDIEYAKGFAVVAAEVRNLAFRSAQAASEIKKLVESASIKSNEGKIICDNMISGYENLTTKIFETKKIIDNVTRFSKEQESGIIQINETILRLDSQTQKNAMTASNIDNLSNQVSNLSTKLLDITHQSKIDEKYYHMGCIS